MPDLDFFLKGMKHIHGIGKTHGIHGAKGVAVIIANHFKHAGSETFPGFGPGMFAADLRQAQCISQLALNRDGELQEILLGGTDEGVSESVMNALRGHFRPEFLNRVDEVVLFKPLLREQIAAIVELMLGGLRARLADRKIGLTLSDAAKAFIAETAYDPVYGARPLRRYLQAHIETPLAKALIGGQVVDGQTVTVDMQDGALVFV